MKALLVDDDGTTRLVLEAILMERGHQVTSFADAESGWSACLSEEFPLIILDWLLPGMNGLDLCRHIRNLPWGGWSVILINSVRDRPEDLSAALDAGATDYLIKPADANLIEVRLTVAERTAADLARRHRVEDELREREERYRVLAENTSDLICELDSRGQFLYISPNCRMVLGFEASRLFGQSIFAHVHTEDIDSLMAEFVRVTRFMRARKAVFRIQHQNGDWRWFESTGNMFRTALGDLHAVMVARDITDRRRSEEERLRASKLDSIGLLAGGIAHDFNNILMAILGNVSLANLSLHETRRVATYLVDVEKACLRARDLTQRLLTFAKGGAPVKKAASLAELVQDSIKFALSGSNVQCEFLLPENLWAVEVDEGQISQVLQNLAINSHQAMSEGGRLVVAAENISFDESRDSPSMPQLVGPYVLLRISDTGVGIPPEHLSKIFDPYFTTKDEGSGLGLATAYSVIKNHGGHITVDSVLGHGTTFCIYLVAAPTLSPPSSPVNMSAWIGSGRVLVMDDEPQIRQLLAEILEQLGYEVECAKDGSEAIRLYHQALLAGKGYDLVLMDLTIPGGMGGKETIQHLRKLDPAVRGVVLSGYSNDPVLAEYGRYGFCGRLAKPYTVHQLSSALSQACKAPRPAGTDS